MAQITYADKSAINVNPDVASTNKVEAGDMNEIKSVVNANDTAFTNATTYSTTEIDTGKKWIDGKPIYRKTYDQNSVGNIDVSSLNIDTGMIDVSHSFVNIGGRICPIQLTTTSASNEGQYMVGAFFNNTKTTLTVEKGSALTVSQVVITIEYTKTTD